MGGIFDTHCHLFMHPLAEDLPGVFSRAGAAGVDRMLVPAVSRNSWNACVELSGNPGVSCALGVHPWWSEEGVDTGLLRDAVVSSAACAIGEIGLDWKCAADRKEQRTVFQSQLQLAVELEIPVILHCRGAFQEMLELVKDHPVSGAVHAWSRHPELMERFLEAGLYISFGGAVTVNEAENARASARAVPSNRFLVETDAPSTWLSGNPSGGSEPSQIINVVQQMAMLRDQTVPRIILESSRNAQALFKVRHG